ncbi:MAG TPA: flagellar motor protein [Terriglobia bacterium]|nr:flagellar motor protein [Terriglobia bacterium]
MDIASIIGIVLGLGAVLGGAVLEGLHFGSISQPTAAIIVLGGTLGATTLSFPLSAIIGAAKGMTRILLEPKVSSAGIVQEIIALANKARKEGLISLEGDIAGVSDGFLRKALSLAVDGTDSKLLRETMEIELDHLDHEGQHDAKVFEAAGGYAPTIGIIGAVLGLIHVMENLSDPSKLGSGIAVAFVATVYGVSMANLFFLPCANKLKLKHQAAMSQREMMLDGVLGILEGINPRVIEEKLNGYLSHDHKKTGKDHAAGKASAAAA